MPPPEINCDFGEGQGPCPYGDDAGLAPLVGIANIACGVHGGDPGGIAETVRLAKRHGLKTGAHPSLPDREGFGRRRMQIGREALADAFVWQIGALKGFLDREGLALNHVKPHGVIYSMAARDADLAEGLCDAAEAFGAPLFGIAGTETEAAARRRGLRFVAEFFADLAHDDDGGLLVRKDRPIDPAWVAARLRRALGEGVVETLGGRILPVRFQTVCIHNDMPNAAEIAAAARAVLTDG